MIAFMRTFSRPAPTQTYKAFKSRIKDLILDRMAVFQNCGFDPVESRAAQTILLDGLVDIDQADAEMYGWLNRHGSLRVEGFLKSRPWMREDQWRARRNKAISQARAIVERNGLTRDDLGSEWLLSTSLNAHYADRSVSPFAPVDEQVAQLVAIHSS